MSLMTHIAKVYKFSIKNKSNRYGRNKMGNKIINALMLFDSFRFVYKRCIFPTLDVGKKLLLKIATFQMIQKQSVHQNPYKKKTTEIMLQLCE